jgi:diaminopimelate decarboxylase
VSVVTRAARRDLAVVSALHAHLLDDDAPLAAFIDLTGLAGTVASLREAWRSGAPDTSVTHTFAAKANCLVPVLRILRSHGLGCEVASAGELAQALTAGFAPDELVFDSPAKTGAELAAALAAGIAVNVDSFQELERVDALMAGDAGATTSRLGIRLNPQIGTGAIDAMSTAGPHSKFGIALRDPGNRERLTTAYLDRPWLRWVHVHVGSQGLSLAQMTEGVAAAVAFADEVNAAAGHRQVEGIDIGGGLSVDFSGDDDSPSFDDHVSALKTGAPGLLDGYRVVTEFGRALLAKNGFLATKVEYTKTAGGRPIAVTHAGAHVATRTAFSPDAWPLRVLAYDPDGRPSTAPAAVQDVAGPCCFAGDLLARGRRLPLLAPGDVVVIPDTGAYYFSTPFRYNSLPAPAVYGFDVTEGGVVEFSLLRRAETVADVVAATLGEPVFATSRQLAVA